MGKVRIYEERVNEAKAAAKNLEQSIKTSHDTCEQLISYVSAAEWSGKARDSFLSYLEIIQKYHKDIELAVELQTKALNNIEGHKNDFLQDSSVKEVRNL